MIRQLYRRKGHIKIIAFHKFTVGEGETLENKRGLWIDYIKVFACILVVLGHLYHSMVSAGLTGDTVLYDWFIATIYCFHVALFFVCSGFLYQKHSCVKNVNSWKKNVLKKFINLGIPYFVFSFATWLLKTVFSNSVNNEIDGLFEVLFLEPTAPYWYLYCLFFVFLITPTVNDKKSFLYVTLFGIISKLMSLYGIGCSIYAVNIVLGNEIWFVLGIFLCMYERKLHKVKPIVGVLLTGVFLIGSVWGFRLQQMSIYFALGVIACMATVIVFANGAVKKNVIFDFLAKYTMPIYLMHTLVAAPCRIVLLRLGVDNLIIHVIVGLVSSFLGPIIIAEIMAKLKWMEIALYPGKFIRLDSIRQDKVVRGKL